MNDPKKPDPDRSQSDKFKDLAREVEADEDEQAFDDKLRRMRYDDTSKKESGDDAGRATED